MKKFDVHVCMVSGQAVPNLIPVLATEFRPQKVVLLVTPSMKKTADALEKAMKERACVKVQQIALADEYDMQAIKDQVFDLLINIDKDKVALNVTGGTKLMAIGAYNLFHAEGYSSFYFTERDNSVILLDDAEKETLVLQPPKLKIEDYLALHGHPVKKGCSVRRTTQCNLPDLWHELIRAAKDCAEPIKTINAAIAKSDHNALTVTMPKVDHDQQRHLDFVISLFEEAELLQQKNGKLQFADLESKKYVGGGWFEDYVFTQVKSITGIQDVALNIELENQDKNIHQHNELDVVVLANNALHVIECKTSNLENKDASDILYKLATFDKLGGLKTRQSLVSYHPIASNNNGNNPTRDRAKGLGIHLLERTHLSGLKAELKNWLKLKL